MKETKHELLDLNLASNPLEQNAIEWFNDLIPDYSDTGVEGVFNDLEQGGCASGMVRHLIYYSDTCNFFEEHKKTINQYLEEFLADTGQSLGGTFTNWDENDTLALDTKNQNILAWFGFEHACYLVFGRWENR